MKVGDTVKMVKVHHAMNSILKKYLWSTGVVVSGGDGHPRGVCVHFDKRADGDVSNVPAWWVKEKYLKYYNTKSEIKQPCNQSEKQ